MLVGRAHRTLLAWSAGEMPTELLGVTQHVRHVCDLVAWQRKTGRRHSHASDYL